MASTVVSDPGTEVEHREPSKLRRELLNLWIPRVAGYVAFLALWQAASGTLLPGYLLPSPVAIVQKMAEIATSGLLSVHFGSTLRKIAIGFGITYVLGTVIGILMAKRWFDAFFRGYVMATLTTPGLVFALIAAMIFGFRPLGPIVAIVVTSLPFVVVNVVEGAKAMPKDLIDMSRAFGMPGPTRMRHIVIPFLAPYLFTALRYGFSVAWKIATLTEVFGSSSGIGFMMRREFQSFSMTGMLSWIFYFFVFALFLEVLLQRGMKRFFRWRIETRIL
jgi:NitT/TauT family transport system permease protein